ncbi:hypothetical protein [Flavihumibacter petaseus]|uniref:hypothetical protein n=1 Tax=Flavihumibacter petaseus TaxID=549295 RepID=UPI00061D3574|nr:hypothetical protein [Flavihumibacter petaseus]
MGSPNFLLRFAALLFHAFASFLVVNYFLNMDLSGSWLLFSVFVLVVGVLVFLFLKHVVYFRQHITKTP